MALPILPLPMMAMRIEVASDSSPIQKLTMQPPHDIGAILVPTTKVMLMDEAPWEITSTLAGLPR